jgi:hypothetical protein
MGMHATRIAPPRFAGAASAVHHKRVEHETIYARRRFQAILAAFVLVLVGLAAHSNGANALAIGLAVSGVVAAAFLVRRPRLEIRPDGLTVVNFARSHSLPWSEIAGFGFGSGRMVSCLAIRRRDGSTVNAVALSDAVRSGYSPKRVGEIVSDLQERLRVANGSSVVPDLALTSEPRARRTSRSVTRAAWILVCAFFVVFGIATAWKAAFGLPRTYSRLASHGVRATATFAGCRVTGIRRHECRLSLADDGSTRTWNYPQDFPQFDHLLVGAVVQVLVDPDHPATVYTVHDVDARYDAGFGVLGIFGIVLAVIGALGFAWNLWSKPRLGAKRFAS